MLKLKCFIIGMVLSLPLPANGIVFCPLAPLWVIVRRRKLDEERREREQRELNEQTKQGNMVNNENQEMTLPETVVVLMSFVALLCFLKEDYEK